MIRRNAGFTLVEMLIVIAIFGLVLAGTSQMFIDMLRTHRQQSRITETNIEGVIGLELLRQDLEKAGYGLPWNGMVNYQEKATNTLNLNDAPTNPPRGIVGVNNVTGLASIIDNTDYLSIKASNIATNSACNKWTFLLESGGTTTWSINSGASATSENFNNTDRVIVISPGTPDLPSARTLVTSGPQFSTQFSSLIPGSPFVAPAAGSETRVVYGIDPNTNLRMPFNRADYFVMQPSSSDMPQRCAKGTGIGILYKAVVNQNGGELAYMPLLDCVADMQVYFRRDLDGDGTPENLAEDISLSNAPNIRSQVKEVRVFILAHEGQKDTGYTHPTSVIRVGELIGGTVFGRDLDLSAAGITDWQNYRWKVYTLVVKLDNLR